MSHPRPLRPCSLVVGLILFLWAGVTGRAHVLSENYAAREWHMADGLPHEQIMWLTQDSKGFLWVATIGGVARFDGAHFEEYPLRPEPGVYSRLMVNSSTLGLIAAPIQRRGLVILREGAFVPWREAEFGERVVTGLFAEPGGAVWITCEDGPVIRHTEGKSQVFEPPSDLPRARLRSFATDAQGGVWMASDGVVQRFRNGAFEPPFVEFEGTELRIGSSSRGGPWLFTRDRLLRLENEKSVVVAPLPPLLGAHYVQAIQEDRDGALWFGTRSQGLHIVNGARLEQVATTHEDIFALGEDREGNLWVGSNGGGLSRIRKKGYRVFDKTVGLLDNQTHTILEDRDGSVWFANRDGGVARWRGGEMELMMSRPDWPQFSATSIFPLPGGRMGITAPSGNFEFARDGNPDVRPTTGLPALPVIRVTFAARNGDVWFAFDPGGAGRLREGKFTLFGPEQGMNGQQVRGLAEDASGRIWIGAAEGKLFRSDPGGEHFERVALGDTAPGTIQAIHFDDEGGIVWLGTVKGGIVALIGDTVRSFTTRQGLPDANITQILADGRGYLWFGSKRGVFRLNRQEILDCLAGKIARVTPLVIGQEEGVRDFSCQGVFQPAACRTHDGRLWFATRRGVLSIDPTVQMASSAPPPVAIEEIRCDDARVALTRPLNIASTVHKLEIRFGVLNLSAPDRVHAKYRLDNFDDRWLLAPANRVVTYPRLPPGRYQFHVTASGGDGAINEIGDTLAFVVAPQWWQTWWFRSGVGLGGILVVALMVRAWSHRRLRERLERLERERAVERERHRIAQNIHDDLGASLTRISLLTQQARHEDSAGAEFYDQIHDTATDITRSMDEIVWAVNPKYDDLESLVGYVGNFARNFLSVAGIRCRLDVPDELPPFFLSSQMRHHLFLSCKEALNNVVKHAAADEVTISIQVESRSLRIVIKDNGRGNPVAARAGGGPVGERRVTSGAGLANMRRRMEALAGRCEFFSREGEGSTVTFTVPLILGTN